MWKTILDLILPIHCLGCNKIGEFLCADCLHQIPLNQESPLISDSYLERIIITSNYQHSLVQQVIQQYKYSFIKDLAYPLGELMSYQLAAYLQNKEKIVLVPVPLHQRRLRWRGFNQAELLASVISHRLNIPLLTDILIRQRHTQPQVKITNAVQRKTNLKEAFQIRPNYEQRHLRHKRVVLIDDILTTGATLTECAKALSILQPKEIWGLVFAKG